MSNCTITQSNDGCSIYTGKGAPSSSLGTNGSIFISETAPYWVYKKSNGTWIAMFQMQGANGTSGSDNILLNDMIHVIASGSLSGANIFNYTFDVDDIVDSGDVIQVYALVKAENTSTYANPVTLAWYLDGVQLNDNYTLRADNQEMYLTYDLTISKVDATTLLWSVKMNESFDNEGQLQMQQYGTSTIDLSSPNTYPLQLKASATDCTITPIQLLVMQFKTV